MSRLLDELVASARARAKKLPRREPERRRSGASSPGLLDALRGKDRLHVIAEFKKRSPSLGAIVQQGAKHGAEHDLETRVKRYADSGAAAVSVLTEPTRFDGSLEDLERAARAVEVPVLMKDFVVDPAQVREAARLGARGVLLIVRCLSPGQLDELVSACSHYGVTALVECHSIAEVESAIGYGSVVLGINNRDLDTLAIDLSVAPRLLAEIPRDRVAVAESGYETARDVSSVRGLADAVLVGSALMKVPDPAALIAEMGG